MAKRTDGRPGWRSNFSQDLVHLLQASFINQIQEVRLKYSEWPFQALLCRGFIAELTDLGAIVLSDSAGPPDPREVSAPTDLELAFSVTGSVQTEAGVLIPFPSGKYSAWERTMEILSMGFPLGGGGAGLNSYNGSYNGHGWGPFLRCKFGPKVPVSVLDPGIALLVKALPLIGARSVCSCDGHRNGNMPQIELCDRFHVRWLRGVMRFITPDSLQDDWQFEESRREWSSNRWIVGRDATECDTWIDLHRQTVAVARKLLDRELLGKIRNARARIQSPEDLSDDHIAMLLASTGATPG